MGGGRLAEIDLLRGYAVALVLWLHLDLTDPLKGPVVLGTLNATEMGLGVDLFFIISGYVISRALASLWAVRTMAQALTLKDFPLVFYRRRFARLWPATALWLLLVVVLDFIFTGRSLWPPLQLVIAKAIFGLVYLSNFEEVRDPGPLGYFWSLSVEWQFYLLFPLLLLLVRKDSARLAVLGLALALSIWLQPDGILWHFLRFDGLAFGILLYVLLHRLELSVPHYRIFRNQLQRQAATLVLLVAIVVVPKYFPVPRLGYTVACGLGTVLVGMAALDRGYIGTFGFGWLVRWLGSRSYSIYLVHMPVILSVLAVDEGLRPRLGPGWLLQPQIRYWWISLLCIAIAAELTYRLVERPSHRASATIRTEAPAGTAAREPRKAA